MKFKMDGKEIEFLKGDVVFDNRNGAGILSMWSKRDLYFDGWHHHKTLTLTKKAIMVDLAALKMRVVTKVGRYDDVYNFYVPVWD